MSGKIVDPGHVAIETGIMNVIKTRQFSIAYLLPNGGVQLLCATEDPILVNFMGELMKVHSMKMAGVIRDPHQPPPSSILKGA